MKKSLWGAIPLPDQVKRLLIVVIIIGTVFLGVRGFFIPETFGEYGHYRAASVDSIMAHEIKYAGHQICAECHDDIEAMKNQSNHKMVNCEACHGPANAHAESGGEVEPVVPRDREHCALCHAYNPAKPTGYPQIDIIAHNPVKQCTSCHDPHAPEPPVTPGECAACHASISRTKALSPHAPLECTVCHETPLEHKINPRLEPAGKPADRSECGQCHARNSQSDRFIPRIDMDSHGDQYPCWQCHYPHFPEAN
jgi:ribosomal protein S27AE